MLDNIAIGINDQCCDSRLRDSGAGKNCDRQRQLRKLSTTSRAAERAVEVSPWQPLACVF